jgi:hypothetical protein
MLVEFFKDAVNAVHGIVAGFSVIPHRIGDLVEEFVVFLILMQD